MSEAEKIARVEMHETGDTTDAYNFTKNIGQIFNSGDYHS